MIHLHTRSCYSLLQSTLFPEQIVRLARENHMEYAALTDKNVMSGVPDFIKACTTHGIKPIIGLEITIRIENMDQSLLLLAKNNDGLRSLYHLSSLIETGQFPADLESLEKVVRDCFVIGVGADSFFHQALMPGSTLDLESVLYDFLDRFDQDFLIGLAINDDPRLKELNDALMIRARALNIPLIALSMIFYQKEEDYELLRFLEAISKQTFLKDPMLKTRKGRFYRTAAQMEQLYDQELLDQSEILTKDIHYVFEEIKNHLPVFPTKSALDSEALLKGYAELGLKKRFPDGIKPSYKERLDYELGIIESMGFADYFLIVWDMIREARKRGILVGPGRGSAAGSLVAYCLGITHIDPIENGLLFERFLNPQRISMPDIDTDFPDDRRDEMILYLQDLYGKEHVSHIAAFSTMQARMVLRDCARVLSIKNYEVDELCQMISANQSLLDVYKTNTGFQLKVDSSKTFKKLFSIASRLEGLPRHMSVHAGGIVISREPIWMAAPLISSQSGVPSTQFSMNHLENLGLVKFDLLSIRNLSLLEQIRKELSRAIRKPFDLFKIPFNDQRTYELIARGDTLGIFQMESDGIRDLARRYQPKNFSDIAAILALYRPGPMKNIDLYLKARNTALANPYHPLLENLLKESAGIFIYQEQIMKAAEILGDFSLAQADLLRKAMSKKNRALMEDYRKQFLQAALAKGLEPEQAKNIFETMERFTEYGFNKSHSYAYGLVVYWMAFCKANFPFEFYKVLLNSTLGNTKKLNAMIREARNQGIRILPLAFEHSRKEFIIEKRTRNNQQQKALRLPLGLIRELGLGKMDLIEKSVQSAREKNYLNDPVKLLVQMSFDGLEKKDLELLIKSGLFDRYDPNPETLLDNLERIVNHAQRVIYRGPSPEIRFGIIDMPYLEPSRIDLAKRSLWQKEIFGFYLNGHPASLYKKPDQPSIQALKQRNGNVHVIGQIIRLKQITTRTNKKMSFITLEDDSGSIDMAVMPKEHEIWYKRFEEGMIIEAYGKKDRENSFLANSIHILNAKETEKNN